MVSTYCCALVLLNYLVNLCGLLSGIVDIDQCIALCLRLLASTGGVLFHAVMLTLQAAC
jgi:hypothetical protein